MDGEQDAAECSYSLLYDAEPQDALKRNQSQCRTRKRKICEACGEEYSHSAYYRHKRFCTSKRINVVNVESDNSTDDDAGGILITSQSSSSSCFSLGNNEHEKEQPLSTQPTGIEITIINV